jgi:hypothetical protein
VESALARRDASNERSRTIANRGIELLEHVIATLTGLINKPE